jgi:glycosyltransferase involved in cell wall biosynthesis
MRSEDTVAAPLVSVGLPVYNGARHLAMAIDSILDQTHQDFELLISDNASADGTQEICQRYAAADPRVRYHRAEKNRGLAWNFNRVFELSSGAYFKWMAHDDVVLPTYLAKCLAALEADGQAVMAFPRRRFIFHDEVVDAEGKWLDRSLPDRIESHPNVTYHGVLRLPGFFHPTFIHGLIRPQALRRTRLLGAYPCSDMVLVAELRLQGRFVEVPEPLYYQRHHGGEASWEARKTPQGEAVYQDPENAGKLILPGVRVWWEHIGAVRHAAQSSNLSAAERRQAYLAVARTLRQKVVHALRHGYLPQRLGREIAALAERLCLRCR